MEKAGKYEILRQIGSGGYGVVYEGRDPFIKRRVAIKACTSEEEEVRQRFYGEAEIVGNLEHTNITTVHDFGLENGVPYLVQEYLTGEDLDHMIERQEPMTLARKLDILAQVAEGLGYAHSQGVIHRDIKPGNIRVLEDGRIKIMDFGIAKLKDHKSSLTRTGTTVGTAAYLPPEQIRGQATDHRADVFSFGVTAYELLAGRRPFEAPTLAAMLYKILGNEPTSLAEALPDAPRRLLALVHACLEKDPDQRCPSFREVAAELAAARLELSREQGGDEGRAAVAAPAPVEVLDAEQLQQRVRAALAVGDVSAAELLILHARHGPAGAVPDGLFERLLAEAGAVRMQQGVERHRGEKVEELLRRVRELQHPQGYQEALRLLQAASDLAPRNEAVRVLQAATVAGLQREGEAERARTLRAIADAIAAGNLKEAGEALAAAEDAHGEDAELSALRRRAQELGRRQRSDHAAAQRRGSRVASGTEMDPFLGAPLLQALRQLRTTPGGTLHLENLGIRLYLREGDLCVAAGDPLVREVMTPATPERHQVWLRRLDAWRGEPVQVTAAPPASHITLAAFTPLAPLLMAAAAGGKSDSELERELLPEDFEIAAVGVRDLRNITGLETHDAFVLSRLETPQRLDTLVGLTGLGRGEVVRRLARLAALGWVRAIAPGTWTPAAATESLPDLLSPRIIDDLQQNPLRLSTREHRQRLHTLVARFGGFTHYELLGLDPHAEPAQIHPAFLELARVVHPSHAGRLALGAEAGATLKLLFERACEAYNVLSDQQRRDRYDAEIGVSAATAPQAAEARMSERRELARSFFEQASARARDEDYHFAIELLRQAVRADSRPEYWMLLASCLMRNPKWLAQALHAARQAARQRPSDLELRTLLGEIHERMGEREQATQQFREALELDPGNIAASEGLARLAAAKDARSSSARMGQPQPAGAGPGRPRFPAKRPHRG